MTDDVLRTDGGDGVENRAPVSRSPGVTDGLDTVFDLLSNSRRRYLLYYLAEVDDDVVELSAAVGAVGEYEATEPDAGGRSPREATRIALHHDHLPRLANAGVVDYDPRQGTVRLTGREGLSEWVEHARSRELE